MQIPKGIRPEDVGVFIVYYVLGIKRRDELEVMFRYRGRNTLYNKIKRVQAIIRTIESARENT